MEIRVVVQANKDLLRVRKVPSSKGADVVASEEPIPALAWWWLVPSKDHVMNASHPDIVALGAGNSHRRTNAGDVGRQIRE
mgnify:CR=1 FL=1